MESPPLFDVLSRMISSHVEGVPVALPATVVSYDAGGHTITARPSLPRPRADEETGGLEYDPLPDIYAVPFIFLGGGGTELFWTPAIGDRVLLIFSDLDPSLWWEGSQNPLPADPRIKSLGYAMAIPIGSGTRGGGGTITMDGGTIKLGASATDYAALSAKVDSGFATLLSLIASNPYASLQSAASTLQGSGGIPPTKCAKVKIK